MSKHKLKKSHAALKAHLNRDDFGQRLLGEMITAANDLRVGKRVAEESCQALQASNKRIKDSELEARQTLTKVQQELRRKDAEVSTLKSHVQRLEKELAENQIQGSGIVAVSEFMNSKAKVISMIDSMLHVFPTGFPRADGVLPVPASMPVESSSKCTPRNIEVYELSRLLEYVSDHSFKQLGQFVLSTLMMTGGVAFVDGENVMDFRKFLPHRREKNSFNKRMVKLMKNKIDVRNTGEQLRDKVSRSSALSSSSVADILSPSESEAV